MNLTGNTILITGGGSGIGKALAEYFLSLSNTVIIAGRDQKKLKVMTQANPGMHAVKLDITDPASIAACSKSIIAEYPGLNAVIHNAGMMKPEIIGSDDITTAEDTIATNLVGQIRLNSTLLPHLKSRPTATIITVSSGLAFLPRADFPSYCATKAAIHSYTQSLRFQLRDTAVQVIELIPPYVQTELQGPDQAADPMAMPLVDFISQATAILENDSDTTEVAVERVQFQRGAEASGEYPARYKEFNNRFIKPAAQK